MPEIGQVQLGKQGISDNFIGSLRNHFKNYQNVKVSVLKNARKNKSQVKEFAKEILERLGKNYTARIVGFTIVLKKWRKAVR